MNSVRRPELRCLVSGEEVVRQMLKHTRSENFHMLNANLAVGQMHN